MSPDASCDPFISRRQQLCWGLSNRRQLNTPRNQQLDSWRYLSIHGKEPSLQYPWHSERSILFKRLEGCSGKLRDSSLQLIPLVKDLSMYSARCLSKLFFQGEAGEANFFQDTLTRKDAQRSLNASCTPGQTRITRSYLEGSYRWFQRMWWI